MEFKRIIVVGSGFMGSGIAHVLAAAGYEVILHDITDACVQKGMAAIEKKLTTSVEKGKLCAAKKVAIVKRISLTTNLALAGGCDLVVEAIVEKKQDKMDLFRKLDGICPPEVVFSSNTLSFPITELATATKRPTSSSGCVSSVPSLL